MSSGTRAKQGGTVTGVKKTFFLFPHKANQVPFVTCLVDPNLAHVSKHMPDDALALYFLLKLLVIEKQALVQLLQISIL